MARKAPRKTARRRKAPAAAAASTRKNQKKPVRRGRTMRAIQRDAGADAHPGAFAHAQRAAAADADRGAAPPAKIYQPGTSEFRYYACATSLRRGSDFWGSISPALSWEIGKVLPVVLDDGVDLNAFYTRGGFGDAPGLHFFHAAVGTRTFFSAESPDVVCHEMGHAILTR